MRIGLDVSYIQDHRAGIGRFAIELLRKLLASQMDNEYVLHGWSLSLDRHALAGLAASGTSMDIHRVPGTVKRLYWDRLRWPALERITGPLDVFHSFDPFLPPLGGTKGVCTVHDLSQIRFPWYFKKSAQRRERRLVPALERADAIIVPSEQTRADLLELFSIPLHKIHLVYPPIPAHFHPAGPGDVPGDARVRNRLHLDRPFALFVGTIEPRKNLVSLVKAFEQAVRAADGTLLLVVVGKPGWLFADFFRALENSPVRERILYLRYVPDDELASLYRLACMFIYPSYYEGFGYPVFEAMASGTPVITSRSSSLEELAGGAAELVDPPDVGAIARAIVALSVDDGRRRELAAAGRERVRRLASIDPVKSLGTIYRHLAAH